MTYRKDFVVAVRSGGRVLAEVGNDPTVHLPFGSEYSIVLKNLHGTRAQVQVYIDGKDVLYGKSIVIGPNQKVELERYVKDLLKGKRFRFIEKTAEVVVERGDEVDDSIIHVSYRFERPGVSAIPITYVPTTYWPYWEPTVPRLDVDSAHKYRTVQRTGDISCREGQVSCYNSSVSDGPLVNQAQTDVGKTVKGSSSKQSFTTTSVGTLEDETHVINVVMRGFRSGQAVAEPVTVKKTVRCGCGKVSKSGSNFCRHCGDKF
jgi:hypothetical protein